MGSDQNIVIVGGGLAAGKAVETLRDEGYAGGIVLCTDEADRPYERPPLSKGYLNGKDDREKIFVHPEGWYPEHDVDLRLGTAVTAIDREAHEVVLADGSRLGYDKLLLATGSSPRMLDVPGADLDGVHYLRRVGDSERIRAAFEAGGRVVAIGAGWIGLEAAAAARGTYGCEVTVVEPAEQPLLGALGPELGAVFAALHRDHGVDLRLGTGVAEIRGSGGQATSVVTSDGAELPADVVIVGVGIKPNIELAAAAGLAVDNGILTDARLQTTDPDIFAAGDVANAHNPLLGRNLRVEHWANALNQGKHVAGSLLGRDDAYDRVPYFYTDQYDLGMEYSGYAARGDYEQVVYRGDRDKREFIAFWLKGGRVLAGMNVNVWDVVGPIQELIRSGAEVDPARLADPAVPLEELR